MRKTAVIGLRPWPAATPSHQSVIAMARSAMRSRTDNFSVALLSWPQAARCRGRAGCAPARHSRRGCTISANFSICSQSEHSYGAPGQGLNGIRLILAGNARQQLHQRPRIGQAVVDALQHHIFEGDAPRIGGAGIGAAGLDQLGDRIFLVDRHHLVADFVAHRVQRDRQAGADLAPARAIIGTTPAVDSVTRRLESASPSPSVTMASAVVHTCRNCRAARPCPSSRCW